jgi:predicted house-cleaning noncanonical NTP pyrophosphatase (MazG superfamily)
VGKKGISIPIASDTRDFSQGVQSGVVKPLEGVEDALEDVAKEGDRAGESLEDALRGAQRETEELADEHKALGKVIREEASRSSRAVSDGSRSSTRDAKRGLDDLKDESRQTARESAASFDGSAQSIVDAFQEVSANAFVGFGPAGIAAGLAIAAGIGLAGSAITAQQENTEAFKQKVAELTAEFLESGSVGKRSFSAVLQLAKGLATETDDSKTNLEDLRKVADTLKVPLSDVVYAYAQGGAALDNLIGKNRELITAENDRLIAEDRNANSSLGSIGDLLTADGEYQRLLDEINGTLTTQKGVIDAAGEASALAAAAGLSHWQLKADVVDAVNEAYDTAAGAVDDYVDAETGIFNVARYIAAMQAREQALKDYQQTLASSPLTAEAKSFLTDQGAEAAAQFLAGYKAAAPEQQSELNRLWTEAGRTNSAAYIDAAATGLLAKPLPSPVVTLDTLKASQQLDELFKKPQTVKLQYVGSLLVPVGKKVP